MNTRTEPHNDPVSILLGAAMDIREAHKPDADGGCPGAEYCSEDLAGGCLPYRTAETVLDLWADRSYLKPTGTANPDGSHAMWTDLDQHRG
jgi:hypothetical protein